MEVGMCSEREGANKDLVLMFGSLLVGHEHIVEVHMNITLTVCTCSNLRKLQARLFRLSDARQISCTTCEDVKPRCAGDKTCSMQ